MNEQTIEDIYSENARIRERLRAVLASLNENSAGQRAEADKWSVAELVEHISMVDEGMTKICAKLLRKSREAGKRASAEVMLSEAFLKKTDEIRQVKLEAPEIVRPRSNRTIAESLAKLEENQKLMDEIRPHLKLSMEPNTNSHIPSSGNYRLMNGWFCAAGTKNVT